MWWGLGIVVACLVIIVINGLMTMGDSTASDELAAPLHNVIYRLIYHFGIWPIILFIGVVVPISEELCFRLWGNGKRWTGYTSVVFISLCGLAFGWWLGLLTLAAGIAIMIVLRNDRAKRLFALMMLSSITFALMHTGNYDATAGGWIMYAVGIIHKFGLSLVASYLVINHNILWAIGLHILNNSIVAIPMGIAFHQAAEKVTTVTTEDYTIEVSPLLLTKDLAAEYTEVDYTADTVVVCDFPAKIASEFGSRHSELRPAEDSTDLVGYNYKVISYPKMKMKVVFHTQPHNVKGLINTMIDEGWIAADTADSPYNYVQRGERYYEAELSLTFRTTYNPLKDL
ncbi:MAG: CPBP family intramembrane metalloprotease [Bacteroidales bacterium]|nr:CPBP family intramembrane metalloprotease [Bacteroidales bacterium]